MPPLNISNFNMQALGMFSKVKVAEGSKGDAIVNLNKAGGHLESTRTYKKMSISSKDEKQANNEVRNELLKSLKKAFGCEKANTRDFLAQLEKTLGKNVVKASDFGLDKNGKATSGCPLTERRISAIVDELQKKAVGNNRMLDGPPGALKQSLTNVNGGISSFVTKKDGGPNTGPNLSIDQCRQFKQDLLKALSEKYGTSDLKQLAGRLQLSDNLKDNLDIFKNAISKYIDPEKFEFGLSAENLSLHGKMNTMSIMWTLVTDLKGIPDGTRTSIEEQAAVRMGEGWVDIGEEIKNNEKMMSDFTKADHILVDNKDEISCKICKNPIDQGSVVAYYPEDLDECQQVISQKFKQYENQNSGLYFETFLSRGDYTFVVDGKEFSAKGKQSIEEFNAEIDRFFANNQQLGKAVECYFGNYWSVPPPHLEAKSGLRLGVDLEKSAFKKKLILSHNDDGSYRVDIQMIGKPKAMTLCEPGYTKKPDGGYEPVDGMHKYDSKAPGQDDFYACQFKFDVSCDEHGVKVRGVGDNPSSIKFQLSGTYDLDAVYENFYADNFIPFNQLPENELK